MHIPTTVYQYKVYVRVVCYILGDIIYYSGTFTKDTLNEEDHGHYTPTKDIRYQNRLSHGSNTSTFEEGTTSLQRAH